LNYITNGKDNKKITPKISVVVLSLNQHGVIVERDISIWREIFYLAPLWCLGSLDMNIKRN